MKILKLSTIASAMLVASTALAGGSDKFEITDEVYPAQPKKVTQQSGEYNIYYGDLHNHSDLTYGHGSFENALAAGRAQLDFYTVTPHAMWPDIEKLKDDPKLSWVVGYHTKAFDRLRHAPGYWDNYEKRMMQQHKDGEVVAFLSYEVHSLKYGDHVVVTMDEEIELEQPKTTVVQLRDEKLDPTRNIITPHGVGYLAGYRGYDWQYFKEGKMTPFVEIHSRHGGSETSMGPYPLYHDMGPRDYDGTAQSGLDKGHKFGFVGSTDQHAGYPGSFGDGGLAVLAKEKTKAAIFEALQARRVYATTGNQIQLDFRVDDAYMGEEISKKKGDKRTVKVAVEAVEQIDYVELIKNGRTLKRVSPGIYPEVPETDIVRAKVTLEFGWNQVAIKDYVEWNGTFSVNGGKLNDVVSQFRGAPFTSPQKDLEGNTKPWESRVSKITERTNDSVSFHAFSLSNPFPNLGATQSVVLDVEGTRDMEIVAQVNGKTYKHKLGELLIGSQSHFLNGWLSEAISFHKAVPETGFNVEFEIDDSADKATDYYYLRVRQTNDQWAWSSPIWVNNK